MTLDFDKCICSQAGHCPLFNKKMELDPPNWQWCQSASAEDREKHYCDSQKSQTRSKMLSQIIGEKNNSLQFSFADTGHIIKTEDLVNDTVNILMPQILSKYNISSIIGVPRSGMINAAAASATYSIPLWSMTTKGVVQLASFSNNGGSRMTHYEDKEGKALIIDDTVYGGTATSRLRKLYPDAIIAAAYVSPENKHMVDFYVKEIPAPHFLEWNLFNCGYLTESGVDIDGIFSPNIPSHICDNENLYQEYLSNVTPYFNRLSTLFTIRALVTARVEKYRTITEDWLGKHGIKYQKLIMLPNNLEKDKKKNHLETVAPYKAQAIKDIKARFFIESELIEAKHIKQELGNDYKCLIVCPNDHIYF